ncbi:MAG: dTMP kinase [Clostridia bacterium]|nr:dTMP kinase [Clostridia bacterium]
MQGKFITIEGCEGVGKSTQLALLKEYFENNGIDAIFTREPGGTDVAEKIRSIILDANNKALTPVTELLLYAAARRQHTEEKIIKALSEGKVVVCDRYADSTVAYQGYARNLDKQLIGELNRIAMADVNIDLTLFLDLPPELGFARKGGADKNDRLENEKLDFHKRVYEGYLAVAENNKDRVVRIDSSKDVDGVFAQIVDAMKKAGVV